MKNANDFKMPLWNSLASPVLLKTVSTLLQQLQQRATLPISNISRLRASLLNYSCIMASFFLSIFSSSAGFNYWGNTLFRMAVSSLALS